jgi:hypothetical protein
VQQQHPDPRTWYEANLSLPLHLPPPIRLRRVRRLQQPTSSTSTSTYCNTNTNTNTNANTCSSSSSSSRYNSSIMHGTIGLRRQGSHRLESHRLGSHRLGWEGGLLPPGLLLYHHTFHNSMGSNSSADSHRNNTNHCNNSNTSSRIQCKTRYTTGTMHLSRNQVGMGTAAAGERAESSRTPGTTISTRTTGWMRITDME